jgi:tripartite-type tricarboxylate transporter receptor subunit TctC
MSTFSRRHFLATSSTLLLGAALGDLARAEPVPAGQRLLYGYPSRAIGSELGQALLLMLAKEGGPGYQFQTMDGFNTRMASITAARATADGSTLLQAVSTSLTLLPSVYKKPGFDPLADFRPLACLGEFPLVLAVGPVVPRSVTTVNQYLGWVADNPEFRNIGSTIYGSLGYLAVRQLASVTGASLKVQSYRATSALLSDLHSQSVAAGFMAAGSSVTRDPGGPVRAIGLTGAKRLAQLPQIQTLAEQGITDMDLTGWFGWFTQTGTPASVIQPVQEAIARVQASPAYAALLDRLLLTPANLSPEQITARMREEIGRYKVLVDTLPITQLD